MKRMMIRTGVFDVFTGKISQGYVPEEKIVSKEWTRDDWTPEMEKYKLERIGWLEDTIKRVDDELEKEMPEYNRLMLLFFKDQLRVDLREDRQRVRYKGKIPKHIDDRSVRQASKSFSKYRRWGDNFFDQLKEDVDVHLWGNVVIEQHPTSGGGKF